MCYSNGKIDSLRSKANWLISSGVFLEIVSAGSMIRDRDGEVNPPPPLLPIPVGWGCSVSSSEPSLGLCRRQTSLSLTPGSATDLSCASTWTPAGRFGVWVCAGYSKWDSRGQKQHRAATPTRWVHLSLLRCWLLFLCVDWILSFITVDTPPKHLS